MRHEKSRNPLEPATHRAVGFVPLSDRHLFGHAFTKAQHGANLCALFSLSFPSSRTSCGDGPRSARRAGRHNAAPGARAEEVR